MSTPIPYFLYPFAEAGDATTITQTGSSNAGAVTYQYGFTPNYELDLNTDSSALPVPRPQFNQLMLDITTSIQYLQTNGVPAWIAPGSGGPANYPLFSLVGYNPGSGYEVWESQTASNTSVPGSDLNWISISGASIVQPGTIIDYGGLGPLLGYLHCDGTNYSRATYPNLFKALTNIQNCVTTSGSNILTVTSSVNITVGPKALAENVNIPPGTYVTSITSPTSVTLSANATANGSVTVIFFAWGNTGFATTTFNVPNLIRQITSGSGGSGNSVLGPYVGQSGGADTYTQIPTDVAFHNHSGSTAATQFFLTLNGTVGNPRGYLVTQESSFTGNVLLPLNISPNPTGASQTSMNIIQQTTNVLKFIKY